METLIFNRKLVKLWDLHKTNNITETKAKQTSKENNRNKLVVIRELVKENHNRKRPKKRKREKTYTFKFSYNFPLIIKSIMPFYISQKLLYKKLFNTEQLKQKETQCIYKI